MRTQSLQQQFKLLTISLVVLPSMLLLTIYTFGQISIAKQQNLALHQHQIGFQARLIDYWLQERVANVRELSESSAFRSLAQPQMERNLFLKQQHDQNFDSLSFIDKDGFFKLSTLSTGIRYPSAVGKPYFETARAGKEYISDVVIGRNSGQPIINFSTPIFDYDGNFQGIVLGSVRTTTLELLLRSNWLGETGETLLVNREGTMLTEPRYVQDLIERGMVPDTARMKMKITDDAFRNIQLGASGVAEWIDYRGNKVLGAYMAVPERGWTIIAKMDEAEVLASIYRQLALMAGGTILVVLLILPFARMLTNRIKRPIDWLTGQSNLVATENYELIGHDKPMDGMPRELVTLCDAFAKMSRKIESTVSQLKENETELRSRVLEIQDMNAMLEEEIAERQTAQEALQKMNAGLENTVLERTRSLQDNNARLEEEICERRAVEEALRQSRDELLEQEKALRHYSSELAQMNNELQSFANIIAHDFRSPMVNLKGFSHELGLSLAELSSTLQDAQVPLPENVKVKMNELMEKDIVDSLGFIYSSVDRLDRMVSALLTLARQGRRELRIGEINMTNLIDSVLHSYSRQIADQNISIQVDSLPNIESDQLAMEQIIGNLLDNAIKYLEPGRPGKILVSCTERENEYVFSVQDNGRGIAAEDQDKVFEIFRRAGKQDVAGEGMGLTYVRTLVRHLGGQVWIESNLDVGTTMYFTVPKRQQQS